MNMLKKYLQNLTLPRMLIILACALFSLCTTAYVTKVYILKHMIWLCPLLFVGIFAVHRAILYAAVRIFKSAPSLQMILLSIAAAVLIIAACRNVFFPTRQETYISLCAETVGEICLCDVVVDGENIPVAEAYVVENTGW